MPESAVHRSLEAIWRMESAKIIAKLVRMLGSVGLAEELAQDALVTALEQWPRTGAPENPGAWLMTTAKNRALDEIRRRKVDQRHREALVNETPLTGTQESKPEDEADDDIGDDFLRLMFIACHPVLSTEARTALTLRLLAGLTTAEIARAFVVPEPTIGQRIVRAKRTLAAARVPFEVPPAEERIARLSSVLEVIYLIFNEGYAATAGDDWMRPALCEDALRLGRMLAELIPQDAEVHGLVALMEIQFSRAAARIDAAGNPIRLLEQNRARWDRLLIRRGLMALERAASMGDALGPYALQAAIAACHAQAPTPADTDWNRIVALYDALVQLMPSPIVELNRAVAVSMAFGPAAALELVDALNRDDRLRTYHLLPSVRGDLLEKVGRFEEARAEFSRAARLARNTRESSLLLGRAAVCGTVAQ
ncbi:MAG TPA: RNA polymerase sigma factor [Steroidobacteraceae bacterium]|jgi:RNA polymerase sigma factor (sigma-70 family)|nr:RNA polymerase sigma factor [Steroidobacteraceae bacterium]